MNTGRIIFVAPQLKVNTWRCHWPAAELRRRGYDAQVMSPVNDPLHDPSVRIAAGDTVIVHATNQDVGLSGLTGWLREQGCRVIVQADDDYQALGDIQDTREDAEIYRAKRSAYGRTWFQDLKADMALALQRAHGFIAATPEVLAAYRPRVWGRAAVVHNWIPRWVTELEVAKADPPIAGWFGTLDAHRRDIEWLAQGGRIDRFGVVGDWRGVQKILGYPLAWGRDTVTDSATLYRLLGGFTVGIAPVVDDAFNRAKSWIKPLEFGAVGVPCVVSNVAPYRELWAEDFPVVLVDTDRPDKLVKAAKAFLGPMVDGIFARHPLTEGWGQSCRELIRERFTLEGRGGDEWEKALTELGAL